MKGELTDSASIRALISSSGRFRAFATTGTCISADSKLMCGSSPLAEAITRSEGMGPVIPFFRRAFVRLSTNSRRTEFVGPKFDPPEEAASYPLAEGLLWKY